MRIVHLIESHTIHTKRIVDHQVRTGHEVHVVTFRNLAGEGPVSVIPVPPWENRLPYAHHWRGLTWWSRYLHASRPDIVHGHYLSTAALYLRSARAHSVVASAMGSDVLVDPDAMHARILLSALPKWVELFTSGAPHLTRRMVELGIPEERIATFPWGVNDHVFFPAANLSSATSIVSTRNFEWVYDLPTLVSAFKIMSLGSTTARLDLYGDGSLRSSLEARVAKSGIGTRVRFHGRVDPRRLSEGLRESAVYVSTSKSDAASVSLLEAMATGLVPVVCDIEANRRWVSHGENGLLFPVGDAGRLAQTLRRAITDEDLRIRSRTANPRIIKEKASWDDSMKRLEEIYESVIR